jgi:hypothetical protein
MQKALSEYCKYDKRNVNAGKDAAKDAGYFD